MPRLKIRPTPPAAFGPALRPPMALVLRSLVYAVLVLSAGTTLWVGDRLWVAFREGILPFWAPLVPPAVFALFVLVYALDRWMLVRAGRFSASRALLQVGFCLVFVRQIMPPQAAELRQPKPPPPSGQALGRLLAHPEPSVRQAACELASGSLAEPTFALLVGLSHTDPEDGVRRACAAALARAHLAR